MGVETAVLAGLTAANSVTQARQARRAERAKRAELKQQQDIRNQQLQDRKRQLQESRRKAAAALRARYTSSGLSPQSRTLRNLLAGVHSKSEAELQSLNNLHRLRSQSFNSGDNGHTAALLRGLQKVIGS